MADIAEIKRLYPDLEYPERYDLVTNADGEQELVYKSVHDGPVIDASISKIASGEIEADADRAEEAAKAAQLARDGVEEYEAKARKSAEDAEAAKNDVAANATKAETAANAAKDSETASKSFETAAGKSATDADKSKKDAEAAQVAAEAAKSATEGLATAAGNSATQADQRATDAESAAGFAGSAATAAEQARQAIEALGVLGVTLPAGSDVAVEKIVDESGAVTLKFSIPQGVQGVKGDTGAQGVSITKIERTGGTGAAGTTDTYTITLSNGTTSTFQVYNGKDGDGAGDMLASVYDPQGKGEDIYKYVDENAILSTEKGAPNGVVPTDERGRAKLDNLPYPWEMNGISFIAEENAKLAKLLDDMTGYKSGSMAVEEFTAVITEKRFNDPQLDLRRTAAGLTYTNDTQAQKIGAVRLLKLADDAWESYAVEGKLVLTWQQVQYALINDALAAPETAGSYAWMPYIYLSKVMRNVSYQSAGGMTEGAVFGAEARNVRMDDGTPLPEAIEPPLKSALTKETPVGADSFAIVDSADANKSKRVTWASIITAIKTALNSVYVLAIRKVNGKALTSDITLTAGDVGARPSTWVPAWDDVTGKPGTFTPSAHTHPVSDVTGALKQFGPVNITIPVGSWSGSGPWTQNVAVSGVLASWDWKLKLSLQKQTVTDTRKAQEKAMGCVTYCETYNGGVTLTCYEKKPEVNILAVLSGEV